jgi:outer membrane protein
MRTNDPEDEMTSRAKILGILAAPLLMSACFSLGPSRPAVTSLGPPPTAQPAAAPAGDSAQAPQGPLTLTVREAALLGLEQNRALAVQRLTPEIRQTAEETARAAFDPVLSGQLALGTSRSPGASTDTFGYSNSASLDVGVDQLFPYGTAVGVSAATDLRGSSSQNDTTRLGLTVTQPLQQGFGAAVNLASVRQAAMDTEASEYELRGYAETLVAQTEETYWDAVLAGRQIEIYERSLELAKQQLGETEERVRVGQLAEIELAAARSEVALRREALINARSSLASTRLTLLRLVSPPGSRAWDREVRLADQPTSPAEPSGDVEAHAESALLHRSDLNQARLEVKRGDLDVVKTKNGLLPKLDLFITLGKTGYAGSFEGTLSHLADEGFDVQLGVKARYPVGNRAAIAADRRALLSLRQSRAALDNLAELVQVDVRTAHLEVERLREQIEATAATVKLQEEKLRAETEKFRVGRSTNLLVAGAQRDLLSAQIQEVQAVVGYLKALVELYRLDGSLLERRGISAPGYGPVELGG